MDTAQVIAEACPVIAELGGLFYFAPPTLAVGKEHGLDGFRFYFLGRGGVLGDVEPLVVSSAFGYWNPEMIANMWNTAKTKMAPRDAGRLYMRCAQEFGRTKLAGVAGLAEFNAAAEKVVAAADPAGLALFAGVAAEPLAEDAPARAMQLITVLRELRGSVHIVAVVACGIAPYVAHAIRRPDMIKTFGWGEEAPAITDADRANLAKSDTLTDELMKPAFGVLSDTEAKALLAALPAISAALKA